MLYWFDTEFIETSQRKTIDLISIGIVREDGKTYYAISNEFDLRLANKWVKDNVLKKLPPHPEKLNPQNESPRILEEARAWRSRASIKRDLCEFIVSDENGIEFWASWAAYDWVVFCWIFGDMVDLPKDYPYHCNDVIQWMHQLKLTRSFLPVEPANAHNALVDAFWVKDSYYLLKQYSDNRLRRQERLGLKDGSH